MPDKGDPSNNLLKAQRLARHKADQHAKTEEIDTNAPPPSDEPRDDVLLSLSSLGEGGLWLLLISSIAFLAALNINGG